MYRDKKPSSFPVVCYGIKYSLILLTVAVFFAIAGFVSGLWSWTLSFTVIVPIIFVLFFFRNPKRNTDVNPYQIVSPADGTIIGVTEFESEEFLDGPAINISIFLSVFNVHINTSPVDGVVKYHSYREGKMLPAFKSHAGDQNECNCVGIKSDQGFKVLVRQITGFIARRIVWWIKPGDSLVACEKFGMIKFGSRTDVIVPANTKVYVKKGQKVRAGKTIVGEVQK